MEFCFNKDILQNFDKALKLEWLERNKKGAYTSSTIIGVNTRREHGSLVVPYLNLNKKVIVLSKFEESVFVENRLHEISTNQYVENVFPKGYQYLKKFEINPFPRFYFRVEDRLIRKTIFLLEDHNILVVRYELKNQGKPVKIVIKPFLADRFNNKLTNEIQGFNTDSYLSQHFVRWAPKADMPELYVYFNRGEFIAATLWYHNFYYVKDKNRFKDSTEDLFNPGFFQATLNPYETFDIYLSTEEISDLELDYEALYRQESEKRKNKDYYLHFKNDIFSNFQNKLQTVILEKDDEPVVSISTIENCYQVRDIILSLPGLVLIQKEYDLFKKIYLNILSKMDSGLLPVELPDFEDKLYYGAADLSLWFINLGYIYFQKSKDLEFFENGVCEAFHSIYESYAKGTSFNIYADKDGLIFSGDKTTNLSWIPLKNKKGEVLRFGKLLEINALWYNTLKILEDLSFKLNKKRLANRYAKNANKVQESFYKIFVNEKQSSFYDFDIYNKKNKDFRINQIIPLILPFSCIESKIARNALLRIDHELLTPYGLRSLSPKNQGYLQGEVAALNRKTADYYNGAIWPWTISFYVQACLKFSRNKRKKAAQLFEYFKPLLNLADEGLLGFIPEAIHLNESIIQHGMEDYTPALTNTLYAYNHLEDILKE